MVDQELEDGLRAVAAPIRDHNGRTVAAINVSVAAVPHAARRRSAASIVPALVATAARIEADQPR